MSTSETQRSSADIAAELEEELSTIKPGEIITAERRTFILTLRDALNAAELRENEDDLDALLVKSPHEAIYSETTRKTQLPKQEKFRAPKCATPRVGDCGTTFPARK